MKIFGGSINRMKNEYRVRRVSTHTSREIALIPTYRCNCSCKYCFVKGVADRYKDDMPLNDLKALFVWFKRARIRTLLLSGGEPTLYAYFKELIGLLRFYKMRCGIATNNLFPEQMRNLFTRSVTPFFLLHYNPAAFTADQLTLFKENLRSLKKNGFYVGLLVIIHQLIWDRSAIALAKNNKCDMWLATVCPGPFNVNSFPLRQFPELGSTIIDFVRECKKEKVKTVLSRPVIPCMFTADQLAELMPAAVRYRCMPTPVVNPDCSVSKCVNVFTGVKSIFAYKNKKELTADLYPDFKILQHRPLFPYCVQCSFYIRNKCQGGCLAYKEYHP
jgi:hypothetical protein